MWDYGKIMDNKLLLATKALGSRNAKIDSIQKVIALQELELELALENQTCK